MVNYQTKGAKHSYWSLDGDEPEYEEYGEIQEMYFEGGYLRIAFVGDEGLHDIRIPVRYDDGWVDFARSLPVW